MPKTQKELADLAGVSIVTVYNAIHRPEKVRPETREQIFSLMKQYDYLPDAVARSMVRGKTNIVGIIVPTIEVRYYARAIGLMEAELNQAGYRVLISQHWDDPEKEARELSLMREYRVDGIILRNCGTNVDDQEVARLAQAEVPFVLIDGSSPGFENHLVCEDDRYGSRKIVEMLISRGRRRIACLGFHRSGDFRNSNRYEGYCEALTAAGLPVDPAITAQCRHEYTGGKHAVEEVIARSADDPVDAVFCFNDAVALNVISHLASLGVPPQEKILVTGYSGYAGVGLMPFRLPTMVSPLPEICHAAVESLLGQIDGSATPQQQVFRGTLRQ